MTSSFPQTTFKSLRYMMKPILKGPSEKPRLQLGRQRWDKQERKKSRKVPIVTPRDFRRKPRTPRITNEEKKRNMGTPRHLEIKTLVSWVSAEHLEFDYNLGCRNHEDSAWIDTFVHRTHPQDSKRYRRVNPFCLHHQRDNLEHSLSQLQKFWRHWGWSNSLRYTRKSEQPKGNNFGKWNILSIRKKQILSKESLFNQTKSTVSLSSRKQPSINFYK